MTNPYHLCEALLFVCSKIAVSFFKKQLHNNQNLGQNSMK